MIKKKTTLVLGAGASHEVGFPLGKKLLHDIYELIVGQTKGYKKTKSPNPEEVFIENAELLLCLLTLAQAKKDDETFYAKEDLANFARDLSDALT